MGCIDRSKVNTPKSFPGTKSLSKTHHGQLTGKMSSAHGVVPKGATKGMSHAAGRIGAGKRGFTTNYKQGPCPIGSGKNASSNSYKPKKTY